MAETTTEQYLRKISTTNQPAEEATDILTQGVETEGEFDPNSQTPPPDEHQPSIEEEKLPEPE
jgi:hypothetical protein